MPSRGSLSRLCITWVSNKWFITCFKMPKLYLFLPVTGGTLMPTQRNVVSEEKRSSVYSPGFQSTSREDFSFTLAVVHDIVRSHEYHCELYNSMVERKSRVEEATSRLWTGMVVGIRVVVGSSRRSLAWLVGRVRKCRQTAGWVLWVDSHQVSWPSFWDLLLTSSQPQTHDMARLVWEEFEITTVRAKLMCVCMCMWAWMCAHIIKHYGDAWKQIKADLDF